MQSITGIYNTTCIWMCVDLCVWVCLTYIYIHPRHKYTTLKPSSVKIMNRFLTPKFPLAPVNCFPTPSLQTTNKLLCLIAVLLGIFAILLKRNLFLKCFVYLEDRVKLQRENSSVCWVTPPHSLRQAELRNLTLHPGGPLGLLSQALWQGAGFKVQQQGLKKAPARDASTGGSRLTHGHTMPAYKWNLAGWSLFCLEKRQFSYACSYVKCPQLLALGQAKARSQNLYPDLPHG